MFPECKAKVGTNGNDGGVTNDYCEGNLVPVAIDGHSKIHFTIVWKCTECGRTLK